MPATFMICWRLLFVVRHPPMAPALAPPLRRECPRPPSSAALPVPNPAMGAFGTQGQGVDLTQSPLLRWRRIWTQPDP
jgi:hypothetical protein